MKLFHSLIDDSFGHRGILFVLTLKTFAYAAPIYEESTAVDHGPTAKVALLATSTMMGGMTSDVPSPAASLNGTIQGNPEGVGPTRQSPLASSPETPKVELQLWGSGTFKATVAGEFTEEVFSSMVKDGYKSLLAANNKIANRVGSNTPSKVPPTELVGVYSPGLGGFFASNPKNDILADINTNLRNTNLDAARFGVDAAEYLFETALQKQDASALKGPVAEYPKNTFLAAYGEKAEPSGQSTGFKDPCINVVGGEVADKRCTAIQETYKPKIKDFTGTPDSEPVAQDVTAGVLDPAGPGDKEPLAQEEKTNVTNPATPGDNKTLPQEEKPGILDPAKSSDNKTLLQEGKPDVLDAATPTNVPTVKLEAWGSEAFKGKVEGDFTEAEVDSMVEAGYKVLLEKKVQTPTELVGIYSPGIGALFSSPLGDDIRRAILRDPRDEQMYSGPFAVFGVMHLFDQGRPKEEVRYPLKTYIAAFGGEPAAFKSPCVDVAGKKWGSSCTALMNTVDPKIKNFNPSPSETEIVD
jgi:hypothetical protein